jgi:Epoxide hydrolase N terminus
MRAMLREADRIGSFQINISPGVLSDLRERLKNTRWSCSVEGAGWDSGTDPQYLRELVAYWENTYDWRKHEAVLNEFAHCIAELDGITIHFIHERGKGPSPFPIILRMAIPIRFTDSQR